MQPQLVAIVRGIDSPQLRGLLAAVFSDLHKLLARLDQVKAAASADGSAREALFLLAAVRCEGLAAAARIEEARAGLRLPVEFSEELERTGFALKHELRAVSMRALAGEDSASGAESRQRIAEAGEVLRNCFQQLTISLARVAEPGLDSTTLFDELRIKKEESLRLYEDLRALLRIARWAEAHDDAPSLALFSARLEHFRSTSMGHLMQKDFEACAAFADDFMAVEGQASAMTFLHQFSCYLEVLIKHVGMRSVLAEETLAPPSAPPADGLAATSVRLRVDAKPLPREGDAPPVMMEINYT